MGWTKQPKKVCFLCSGKLDNNDYGEIEYRHKEGTDKQKICVLCVKRLDDDEVKEDEQSV
jgi:hypothetical protein